MNLQAARQDAMAGACEHGKLSITSRFMALKSA